jgi:ribonuclease HI
VNDSPEPRERKEHVTIYTDGAAEPNPGPGGYGAVLMAGKHRKELSGGFRKTTNNRMELMAVIVALESLKRPCRVTLFSDSKYVVDSVSRGSVLRWKKKNWFRAPNERAKNVDLWKRFLDVYAKHEVQFRWVKGHAGITENERCDELAVAATQQYDLPVDEGYLEELKLRASPTADRIEPLQDPVQDSVETMETKGRPPTADAILEEGAPCRKCETRLIKKPTKKTKPKPGQTYCYDWYLFCPGCCTMYMVDAAKRNL